MGKERALGLVGQKLGMTQLFDAEGKRIGVTVVELGPCIVLAKKEVTKDGYTALQIGFGDKKEKHATRAAIGHAKKANTSAKRIVKEFRVTAEIAAKYEVGATVTAADVFKDGDFVDVTAKNKGRGTMGVMRRWNFKGFRATHGTHEFFRHGGSIGNREFPGRVFKNRKMAGQWGNNRITVQNVKIAKVIADKNLVLVHGSVPGGEMSIVSLSPAIKKTTKKKAK